jgi:hypothetical protein
MTTPILSARQPDGKGKLLDAALSYAGLDWSIIAVKGKRAAGLWRPFQERAADEATLRRMFARPGVTGLAVVCGAVSGGLAVRDFDRRDSYEAWARDNPDDAACLPTVKTARGFHVYGRVDSEAFEVFGDGELRADSGHYVLLPPSLHPDGIVYTWTVPLPGSTLPPFPHSLTKRENGADREDREDRENRENRAPSPSLLSSLSDAVENAIVATLPRTQGQRHDHVFKLARYLKAIPSLEDAEIRTLRPIVERWHSRALPVIGTKPFLETWADFVHAWENVKVPAGKGAVETAFTQAVASVPPPIATNLYGQGPIVLLAALCRELQRIAGDGEFYLDCRTAGKLIGVAHTTAWEYLNVLCADGVLAAGAKGNQIKASRFRFVKVESANRGTLLGNDDHGPYGGERL